MLERLSQFHNSAAFITDMNALRHSNFCSDRLLANDTSSPQVARVVVRVAAAAEQAFKVEAGAGELR